MLTDKITKVLKCESQVKGVCGCPHSCQTLFEFHNAIDSIRKIEQQNQIMREALEEISTQYCSCDYPNLGFGDTCSCETALWALEKIKE